MKKTTRRRRDGGGGWKGTGRQIMGWWRVSEEMGEGEEEVEEI